MLVKDAVEAAAIVAKGYEALMADFGLPKAIGSMPWHAFWASTIVRGLRKDTSGRTQDDSNDRNGALSMVQWFQSGLPRFDLSHHAAAAFANTDCDNVYFEDAKMPFPCIVIELPNPSPFCLKSAYSESYSDVRMIRLNTYTDATQTLPDVNISSLDWQELDRKTEHSRGLFLFVVADAEDDTTLEFDLPFRDDMTLMKWTKNRRLHVPSGYEEAARMTLNIAINTLVYLHAEGKRYVPSRPVARPRPGAHNANDSGYRPTIYRVGDNIRLNNLKELRDLSRETSRGGQRPPGWTLRSRSTVRGHWKQQAHGPGRALRKRVFVQPYWRGPEAAEALLRAYEVKP